MGLVLLVDRCSVELYLDGGKIYLGTANESTYCDYNLPYMSCRPLPIVLSGVQS